MDSASPQRRLIARLILLAVLFGVVWLVRRQQQHARQLPAHTPPTQQTQEKTSRIPAYVLDVLQYVRQNGHAPEQYVGGREFQNREQRLPRNTPGGERIRYSEWDVHPKVPGQNRGAERLITGSDHSAWYTKDHYKIFEKID